MKRQIINSLLVALTAFVGIHTAQAENIGQGSIRVTLTAEDAANLQVRYQTEDGSVDQAITAEEVLKLSSFVVIDNGGDLKELQPALNSFHLERGSSIGFIMMGDDEDSLVRLNFQNAGITPELFLDFQWTPKFEILASAESKVEVLNQDDEVLHELGEDSLQILSSSGMEIRFVAPAPENDGDDQGGDNQDDGQQDNGNIDLGEQPASGGCSMVGTAGSAFNLSALLVLGSLAVAARRRSIR